MCPAYNRRHTKRARPQNPLSTLPNRPGHHMRYLARFNRCRLSPGLRNWATYPTAPVHSGCIVDKRFEHQAVILRAHIFNLRVFVDSDSPCKIQPISSIIAMICPENLYADVSVSLLLRYALGDG